MKEKNPAQSPVYIFSGGKGLPANGIVQSVLAQYPESKIPVQIIPDILDDKQLKMAIDKVATTGGIILHTMVDEKRRELLINTCKEKKIETIDLMGDLISYISGLLKQAPLNEPGLFRKLNLEYFDRIEAIEYTIASDDGLNPRSIHEADIILTGPSRSGKTPTSIYLAMLGWKVANIPIVAGTDPPGDLFKVDPKRVFGLDISIQRILSHRKKRLKDFGIEDGTNYIDPRAIRQELDYAQAIFRRNGFAVINVTNKPIESVANDIIGILSRHFDEQSRKTGSSKE